MGAGVLTYFALRREPPPWVGLALLVPAGVGAALAGPARWRRLTGARLAAARRAGGADRFRAGADRGAGRDLASGAAARPAAPRGDGERRGAGNRPAAAGPCGVLLERRRRDLGRRRCRADAPRRGAACRVRACAPAIRSCWPPATRCGCARCCGRRRRRPIRAAGTCSATRSSPGSAGRASRWGRRRCSPPATPRAWRGACNGCASASARASWPACRAPPAPSPRRCSPACPAPSRRPTTRRSATRAWRICWRWPGCISASSWAGPCC